jgi:hypothetical protein
MRPLVAARNAATYVRHVSAVTAVMLACCIGSAVAAPPGDDVGQLTTTLPTLNPGQAAWVSTLWKGASVDVTSFQLTADGPRGISISYPENTGSYSSLYKDSTLLADDTDYAAFKVQVGDTVLGNQTIVLRVKYRFGDKGGGNSDGPRGERVSRLEVTLPVVEAAGPTVEQQTSSVGPVSAGSAQWVSVSYKANKPGVTNARLTVTAPAGATVIYPKDGTSTGFAGDTSLSVGATDSASFKIDTGKLLPGSYRLGVDLGYGGGQHLPGTVTLVVR